MTGVSPKGTSGLGKLTEKGFRRVPFPPASITARDPAADCPTTFISRNSSAYIAVSDSPHNPPSGAALGPGTPWAPILITAAPRTHRTLKRRLRSFRGVGVRPQLRYAHHSRPTPNSAAQALPC